MSTNPQILFLRRVEELLQSLEGKLRVEDVAGMRSMIAEGEHADAIRTLAWIVEEKKTPVPLLIKQHICELSRSLVDFRDMP